MTKSELIYTVANLCRIPPSQAERTITATLDVIRDELIADREVNLIGFGKFSVRTIAARKVLNPRTGEEINLSEHKLPTFKPGKPFKQAVNYQR